MINTKITSHFENEFRLKAASNSAMIYFDRNTIGLRNRIHISMYNLNDIHCVKLYKPRIKFLLGDYPTQKIIAEQSRKGSTIKPYIGHNTFCLIPITCSDCVGALIGCHGLVGYSACLVNRRSQVWMVVVPSFSRTQKANRCKITRLAVIRFYSVMVSTQESESWSESCNQSSNLSRTYSVFFSSLSTLIDNIQKLVRLSPFPCYLALWPNRFGIWLQIRGWQVRVLPGSTVCHLLLPRHVLGICNIFKHFQSKNKKKFGICPLVGLNHQPFG